MIAYDVAIAGGGFTGAMIAAHLARAGIGSLCAFEPGDLGRGAAYGTRHREHLLNTPAAAMSAWPGDPDDFLRWLGSRARAHDFVSRASYGEYVNEIAARAFANPRFVHVRDRAANVARDGRGFVVTAASGMQVAARAVVLATGNAPPNDGFLPRAVVRHPGYVADPWRFDYRTVGGHVLLIGTGLTALDVLVALDRSGHRGAVDCVSRRGAFPAVHAQPMRRYDVVPALDAANAASLLRSFRLQVDVARERGYPWQSVVDAVRHESETIWRRLPAAERRRFERHLRRIWDRHRHRAPHAVAEVLDRYGQRGRLTVHRARVRGGTDDEIVLARPDGGTFALRPDWIVNCTGLGSTRDVAREPLLGPLVAAGLLAPNELGVGVRADADYTAIGAGGERVEGLYAVGPLLRGTRFESTAVGELRTMAADCAASIASAVRLDASVTA